VNGPGAVVVVLQTLGRMSETSKLVSVYAEGNGRSLPRGGLDHRHDASADGLGESMPGGHDGGQIGVV
jgi:hypothetical protein